MTLLQIDPVGLNLASLKPFSPERDAQEQAARAQQQLAQVQLTNAQDEQQRNNAFRAQMAAAAKAPSVDAYTQLLAVAPREYVEGLKASISQMDAASKKKLADQVLEPWIAGSNGRLDLMKQKLEAQAVGFETAGMADKAKGVRDLIAKVEEDPDGVVTKLGATYLEAAGPERFKALGDSLGWNTKRRKEQADMKLAEANADPKKTGAALREQLAKAKQEEAKASTIEELTAAQLKSAQLEAQIKAKENQYKIPELETKIQGQQAQAFRDAAAGEHSTELTRKLQLTMDSDVAAAASQAKKEAALAAKAKEDMTPEAVSARKEEQQARIRQFKAQAAELEGKVGDLQPHVQDMVREDSEGARKAFADSVRAREIAAGYRKIEGGPTSSGYGARFASWWRSVAGTETGRDRLYQMAQKVINEDVIDLAKNLRPVSDNDMRILQQGVPPVTANPARVIEYMDALARAREARAMALQDAAAWQVKFRGNGEARKDAVINGRKVRAGMTLDEFVNSRSNPVLGMSLEELRAREAELLKAGKK